MLSKKYRLPIQGFYNKTSNAKTTGKNQVVSVYKKGNFFIITIKSSKLNFSRIGVSVGVKVNKSAVIRNHIKRLVFNWAKSVNIHNKPNNDVMINVLPKANSSSDTELITELNKLFYN
mgnify:CR=1 FL=1